MYLTKYSDLLYVLILRKLSLQVRLKIDTDIMVDLVRIYFLWQLFRQTSINFLSFLTYGPSISFLFNINSYKRGDNVLRIAMENREIAMI